MIGFVLVTVFIVGFVFRRHIEAWILGFLFGIGPQ